MLAFKHDHVVSYVIRNPSLSLPSTNDGLDAQIFQEATEILLLDLHDAVLEAIDPDSRVGLLGNFLKGIPESVLPVPISCIVVNIVIAIILVIVFLLLFALFLAVIVFPLLSLLPLPILLGNLCCFRLCFFFQSRLSPFSSFEIDHPAPAPSTDHYVYAPSVIETGQDKGSAPASFSYLSALIALLFGNRFADPKGEFSQSRWMSEHLNIGAFFDDGHAESAQMADLTLFDKGGASAEDGSVEMLSCGKCVFECLDAMFQVRIPHKKSISDMLLTSQEHRMPPRTVAPTLRPLLCLPHPPALSAHPFRGPNSSTCRRLLRQIFQPRE